MSLHPSLGSAVKGKQAKSVLKRSERIKYMMAKDLWKDDGKVFGLPKIKAVRLKVKKEKAEKPAEEGAVAEAGAPAAAPAAADQKAKAAPKK